MPALLGNAHGLAMLNESVTAQAAMLAYNNSFKLMMIATIRAMPLIALLRDAASKPDAQTLPME